MSPRRFPDVFFIAATSWLCGFPRLPPDSQAHDALNLPLAVARGDGDAQTIAEETTALKPRARDQLGAWVRDVVIRATLLCSQLV